MTMNFRKGVHGPEVKTLQEALKKEGFSVVPDGLFSLYTEQALRAYQRKTGLLPDGLAGPRVRAALGIASENELKSLPKYASYEADLMHRIGSFMAEVLAFARAKYMFYTPSLPCAALHTSDNGLRFIYSHEHGKESHTLHWPEGSSGVTLGSGYDMKTRPPEEIIRDLTLIGIDKVTAKTISGAYKLKNNDAKEFVKKNKHLINITKEQELNLLKIAAKEKEDLVRSNIHVDLLRYEFDTLVSFAYNPGYNLPQITSLINSGRIVDAMTQIKKRDKSGGKSVASLTRRRKDEICLYLGGMYGKLL